MIIRYLSHMLTESIPVFGRSAGICLKPVKSLIHGDSCNTWKFSFQNHWGTHVDCPAHFFPDGSKITDYPPEYLLFKNPQILKLQLEPNEIITTDSVQGHINNNSDLVLFQSGWWNYRNKKLYSTLNPGFHPHIGFWLRKNYPMLRAIGIDWISISAYEQRELGNAAHKAFLDPEGEGHPILIIEDMNLSFNLENLFEIWVAPMLIETIDSAPCSVIGFIGN